MKEFLKKVFVMLCVLSMVIPSIQVDAAKAKSFTCVVQDYFDKIVIDWDAQKNVSYYKIYRVNAEKYKNDDDFPKASKYKKIAKVAKNKTKYEDKKAKKGVLYYYIVKGYKKQSGKDKLVCTTYVDYTISEGMAGLCTPNVTNGGSCASDDYKNTPNKLYIDVKSSYGVEPTGVIIYRKKVGDKKYKKVTLSKVKKERGLYMDTAVKPGNTYRYKAKTYVKIGKKKYYSKKSSYMEVNTMNGCGNYTVESLTEPGTDVSTICLKITSADNNANIRFFSESGGTYRYSKTKKSKLIDYDFYFTKYSFDNKTWKKIPKKGIVLAEKESIYLQGEIVGTKSADKESEPSQIIFGGKTSYCSYISLYESQVEYYGPWRWHGYGNYTEVTLDLVTGEGYTCNDMD